MARRLCDGARLGCEWFVTETGQDRPDKPNPSFHNMLRTGFKVAYELRTASPEEVHYLVKTPIDVHTDRVSTALTTLVPDGKGSVEWDEKKADKAVGAP